MWITRCVPSALDISMHDAGRGQGLITIVRVGKDKTTEAVLKTTTLTGAILHYPVAP